MDAQDVIKRVESLERFWARRNKKFKSWYSQIQMEDLLKQNDMESFVGNDPRASFNLIGSLLNRKIPHRILADRLAADQVAPAAELSFMFEIIWEEIFDAYRQRGRKYMDDLINFILATGYYATFLTPSLDGSTWISEVWNPATVYPAWDDKLSEVAHIFCPGIAALKTMCNQNSWERTGNITERTKISDYWWIGPTVNILGEVIPGTSVVWNCIHVGSNVVKHPTMMPRYKMHNKPRLPIFIAPLGGLPDTGYLAQNQNTDQWKEELGQAFLATNENIYKTSNKWWTYIMQLLRDVAQPRTFEKTAGANPLVKPENWYRRGAHYKLGPQDEIGFIQPPGLPVELRTTQLDIEAMMQRGGPSWAMFGATQQRLTAYAMSQIAATTHQVSRAYHHGVIDVFTDMDNFIYEITKANGYKPYDMSLPDGLPDRVRITADYELRVPGDMVQRATTSRMLNPDFVVSDEYIFSQNFPDVKNPAEEMARVRAGRARKDPVYQAISLIESLKEEAEILRKVGDIKGAKLYEKAADKKEQDAFGQPQQQQPLPSAPAGVSGQQQQQQQTPEPAIRPEVRPPNEGGS